MKKIYITPVVEIESFVTEEIMDNPQNILSYYNGNYTQYQEGTNYINFHSGDNNVLNSINYNDFAN